MIHFGSRAESMLCNNKFVVCIKKIFYILLLKMEWWINLGDIVDKKLINLRDLKAKTANRPVFEFWISNIILMYDKELVNLWWLEFF